MQCVYYEIPIERRLPENMGPTAPRKQMKRKTKRRRSPASWIPYAELAGVLALVVVILLGMLLKTDVTAAETPVTVFTTAYAAEEPDANTITVETAAYEKPWTMDEAEALAKAMWGEARGCGDTHMAGVAWCALNRVDSPLWPDDLVSVLAQKNQFCGYDPDYPVEPHILAIAEDVLMRYHTEKLTGTTDPGRVLPADYYFFTGDGYLNWFRTQYEDTGAYWDWSSPSPYAD